MCKIPILHLLTTSPPRNRIIHRRITLHLRHLRLIAPLARHQRPPFLHPVVVHAAAYVLDPPGLGTLLRRVAAVVPARAAGQRQREHVGHGLRGCHRARARRPIGARGAAGADGDEADEGEDKAADEGPCGKARGG